MGLFSAPKQQSDSYSGLRAPGNDGAFKALLGRTPSDMGFLVDRLQDQARAPVFFNLNADGLLPQQTSGVNTLGRNLFSSISSNYAGRGLMAPDNVAGVIGSAVREASPQLMNMIGQNVRDSILIPEAVRQGRFAQLQNAMGLYPALLGSESHSTSSGGGIGYNFANQAGTNLAQWLNPQTWMGGGAQGSNGAGAGNAALF